MMASTKIRTAAYTRKSVDSILEEVAEKGFCIVKSVISESVADEINRELQPILERERSMAAIKNGHQRVLNIALKIPATLDLMCHSLILKVWRKYLGEDMIGSSWTANTLYTNSDTTYWHVDHPYWTIKSPYPTFPFSSMCIWCLDDFTLENGATAGIPRSHKRPYLPSLGNKWVNNAEVLVGSKGSVILADGAWWHTTRPNTSDNSRSALIGKYIRTFCTPQEDLLFQLGKMENPSDEVKQIFGANCYVPQRGLPY